MVVRHPALSTRKTAETNSKMPAGYDGGQKGGGISPKVQVFKDLGSGLLEDVVWGWCAQHTRSN